MSQNGRRTNISNDDKLFIHGWLRSSFHNIYKQLPTAIIYLFIIFVRRVDIWLAFDSYKFNLGLRFSQDRTTLNLIRYQKVTISPCIYFGEQVINIYNDQYFKFVWIIKLSKLSHSNNFKIGLSDLNNSSFFSITREGYGHCNKKENPYLKNYYNVIYYANDSKRFKNNDILTIKMYLNHAMNTFDIEFHKDSCGISQLLMEYRDVPKHHNEDGQFRLFLHMNKRGTCKIKEFQNVKLKQKIKKKKMNKLMIKSSHKNQKHNPK